MTSTSSRQQQQAQQSQSTNNAGAGAGAGLIPITMPASSHKSSSSFFQQRDALVGEIALSLETVLQNINKLNRSLEGVIAVGNEFGAVEALWSQFEGVMAQEDPAGAGGVGDGGGAAGEEEEEEDDDEREDEEEEREGEDREEDDG